MATMLDGLTGTQRLKPQHSERTYPCSTCHKTFKRNEHCIRHERGHRKEKPFSCGFCGRKYARKDLVGRHERSFHPFGNAELHRQIHSQPQSPNLAIQDVAESDEVILSTAPMPHEAPEHSAAEMCVTTASVANPETPDALAPETRELLSPINIDSDPLSARDPSVTHAQALDSNMDRTPLNEPAEMQTTLFALGKSRNLSHEAESSGMNHRFPLSEKPTSAVSGVVTDQVNHGDIFRTDWDSNQPSIAPENYIIDDQDTQWTAMNTFDVRNDFEVSGDSVDLSGEASTQLRHQEVVPMEFDFSSLFSHPNSFIMNASVSDHFFNTENLMTNSTITQQMGERLDGRNLSSSQMPDRLSPASTDSRRNITGQLPQSGGDAYGSHLAALFIDEQTYEIIEHDVRECLQPEPAQPFTLPSAAKLRRFTASYFSSFHHHFPILHSFTLASEPMYTPLILAISSIGALYRLNRVIARALWRAAQAVIDDDLQRVDSMTPLPIHTVQARLLLTIFTVFGGHVEDAVASTEIAGFWTTVNHAPAKEALLANKNFQEYRLQKLAMASRWSPLDSFSWSDWLARETLLCGIFMLSSLLTVTYDTNPFLSVTHDLNVDIPEPESRWEATSVEDWEAVPHLDHSITRPTVREAMMHLIFEKPCFSTEFSMANRDIWSGFATSIVMHAVNVHMWHIMQCTQSFTSFIIDEATLGHAMVLQVEQALARCNLALTSHSTEGEQVSDRNERPQLFNCQALLRSAYVRIFTGAGSFDRMMLLSENDGQIQNSIQKYVHAPQTRNDFLTKAVSTAYGGLLMPISTGFLLVRKTAALSWSVEHAIAAWDCALFVTKWIYGIETRQSIPIGSPNEAELENLKNFRNLLDEVESDYETRGSLAADVAAIWACFLDDTWVWGVTPRMANLLRLLSKAYADDWTAKGEQVFLT